MDKRRLKWSEIDCTKAVHCKTIKEKNENTLKTCYVVNCKLYYHRVKKL